MTFDQALAELGIDREAGPAEARRAYLKLLKTRKPEVDPQGFMRLREAFDLVKGRLDARESFRAAIEARRAAAEPVPYPPAALDARVDPDPPVEARDIAPDPVAPEVSPDDAGTPEPVVPEERSAPPAPEAAEEDEEDETEEPPSETEADRLLAAGDRAGAAAELARLFDAATKDLGRLPPFPGAMRLILELHEHDELIPAERLEASVVAWLHASGQEVRLLRGNLAIAWAMTRELGALRRKFPKKARAAIARGVRTGDLARTQLALAKLRDKRPSVAEEAAGRLRVNAPVLAGQFANILDPPAPQPTAAARARGSGWGGYMGIVFVLLNLVRLLASSSSSSTPSPSTYRDGARYSETKALYDETTRSREAKRQVSEAANHLATYADSMRPRAAMMLVDYASMSAAARAVASAVREDACPSAWEAMRGLDPAGVADDDARGAIDALAKALARYCPRPAPAADAGASSAVAADAGRAPAKGKGTTKKP